MKKLMVLALAFLLVFTLAACGSESDADKVKKYVEENEEELINILVGDDADLVSSVTIKAVNEGIVCAVRLVGLDGTDEATKAILQEEYGNNNHYRYVLTDLQEVLPELDFLEVRVCEEDGDLIVAVHIDK